MQSENLIVHDPQPNPNQIAEIDDMHWRTSPETSHIQHQTSCEPLPLPSLNGITSKLHPPLPPFPRNCPKAYLDHPRHPRILDPPLHLLQRSCRPANVGDWTVHVSLSKHRLQLHQEERCCFRKYVGSD